MRKILSSVGLALTLSAILPGAETPPPAPFAETEAVHDARMQWWREARFGMFVHWGLYSGLAGTWEGQDIKGGGVEWIQNQFKVDTGTYAQKAVPLFKPKPGFAREWAKLAKAAGCRYIVFTSKHHEGFALHDSKVSDYCAGSVLNRDLVREIVEATKAEGLRVGFYHSLIDWHHDQYEYARSKLLPHPLKGTPYPNGSRDHAKYIDYLHQEVNELMSNYGEIDILWWDYSALDFQGDEAWRATDLINLVRSKQPSIIMNNRLFRTQEAGWAGMGTNDIAAHLDVKYGDFITPEQHIPATGMGRIDWETCMTLNGNWGYSQHDHQWKSNEVLIRNLIDIASKGGNYLLNIGPKADGEVPTEAIQSMTAIGSWMKVNGDAIYGTTASPFEKLEWGRCTQKKASDGITKLYLFVFNWPENGRLVVPGLTNEVNAAYMLADSSKSKLSVGTEGNDKIVALKAAALDPISTVVVLEIKGPAQLIGKP